MQTKILVKKLVAVKQTVDCVYVQTKAVCVAVIQ